MIEYKVDKEPNSDANAHLRDMANVLKEITTTYQILLEVIEQQESALSSPSIDNFRKSLRASVRQAVKLSGTIAEDSGKLATISEQASKHLLAIEGRFSAALKQPGSKITVK